MHLVITCIEVKIKFKMLALNICDERKFISPLLKNVLSDIPIFLNFTLFPDVVPSSVQIVPGVFSSGTPSMGHL